MARGNLAANRLDEANRFAYETERLANAALEKRQLDAEPRLPIALGASLEVQAQVLSQQGQRGEGVRLLERNLTEFGKTSIRARLLEEHQSAEPRGPARRRRIRQPSGSARSRRRWRSSRASR